MLFHVDARFVAGRDPQPQMEAEVAAVAALREEGFIVRLFKRLDNSGAWIIVDAQSEEDAQTRMDALPFPQDGVMTMTVSAIEAV